MKAKIIHDTDTSTVELKVNNMRFNYGIPPAITHIHSITDYEKGYLTMETNLGEEYTDIINIIQSCCFSEKYEKKMIALLNDLKLEDITLERR